MEVYTGLLGPRDEEDSDGEVEMPQKLRKFWSPLHDWDILRSIFYGTFGLKDVEW